MLKKEYEVLYLESLNTPSYSCKVFDSKTDAMNFAEKNYRENDTPTYLNLLWDNSVLSSFKYDGEWHD